MHVYIYVRLIVEVEYYVGNLNVVGQNVGAARLA